MKVAVCEPKVNVVRFQEAFGDDVVVSDDIYKDTELLILWSSSQLPFAERWVNRIPTIAYCWDLYEWAVNGVRGAQEKKAYEKYGEFMKKCEEVWVPSQCTADRLKEFYGIENTHVIRTAVPYFDHEVSDGGYVLQPIRDIPDKFNGYVEKACEELGIPCVSPDHQFDEEKWHETVAHCRFVASALYEGSTGGLSVMEGYYLGKPALGTKSPYSGLVDYMGDRIEYFENYEELKDKLRQMWDNPPQVAPDHREYIKENFSQEQMGKEMIRRLKCVLRTSS